MKYILITDLKDNYKSSKSQVFAIILILNSIALWLQVKKKIKNISIVG